MAGDSLVQAWYESTLCPQGLGLRASASKNTALDSVAWSDVSEICIMHQCPGVYPARGGCCLKKQSAINNFFLKNVNYLVYFCFLT